MGLRPWAREQQWLCFTEEWRNKKFNCTTYDDNIGMEWHEYEGAGLRLRQLRHL